MSKNYKEHIDNLIADKLVLKETILKQNKKIKKLKSKVEKLSTETIDFDVIEWLEKKYRDNGYDTYDCKMIQKLLEYFME